MSDDDHKFENSHQVSHRLPNLNTHLFEIPINPLFGFIAAMFYLDYNLTTASLTGLYATDDT